MSSMKKDTLIRKYLVEELLKYPHNAIEVPFSYKDSIEYLDKLTQQGVFTSKIKHGSGIVYYSSEALELEASGCGKEVAKCEKEMQNRLAGFLHIDGKWIVTSGDGEIIASGENPGKVLEEAKEKCPEDKYRRLKRIPKKGTLVL